MSKKVIVGGRTEVVFEYSDDELFYFNEDHDLQPVSVDEARTIIDFFSGFVKDKYFISEFKFVPCGLSKEEMETSRNNEAELHCLDFERISL